MIMLELGKVEDEIFKTRQQKEIQFKAREKAKKRRTEFNEHRPNWNLVKDTQFAPRVSLFKYNSNSLQEDIAFQAIGQERSVSNAKKEAYDIRRAGMQVEIKLQTSNSRVALEAMFHRAGSSETPRGEKRKANEALVGDDNDSEDEQAHDEVRLWEDGFKDRYYESKFDVSGDQLEFRYVYFLYLYHINHSKY